MSNIDLLRKQKEEERLSAIRADDLAAFEDVKSSLRTLDITLGEVVASGANCDIYRPRVLGTLFNRKNICLKVFRNNRAIWGSVGKEGNSSILEVTKIQNLFAMRGLAPRVYEIVEVNGMTAQVTDYLVGEQKAVPIVDDRFVFNDEELKKDYNFVDGKLVDFQAIRFKDYGRYYSSVLKNAEGSTQWPIGQRGLYQSTNNAQGKRDTVARLGDFDFSLTRNKIVLDVGCNLGMFTRTAWNNGAKRVIGIDLPDVVKYANELAILDGYWNIDFYGADLTKLSTKQLKELCGFDTFDIILYLAVEMWISRPEWTQNCDLMFFEGHGVKRERRYEYPKKNKVIVL